jgi:hypothetical protein
MPHKTGASHVLAALVAMVSTSYLNDILQRFVSTRELLVYANAVTQRAIERFGVAVSPDLLPAIASAVLISALVFVWGWAYHRRVIG